MTLGAALTSIEPLVGYHFTRSAFQKHLKGLYPKFRKNADELEEGIQQLDLDDPIYHLTEAILYLLQVRFSYRPLITHARKGWITQDIARIIQPRWMLQVLKRPMRFPDNQIGFEDMLAQHQGKFVVGPGAGPVRTIKKRFHAADAVARTAEVRTGFRSTAFGILEQARKNKPQWREFVDYCDSLVDNKDRNTVPFQISRELTNFWDQQGNDGDFLNGFMGKCSIETEIIEAPVMVPLPLGWASV